MAKLINDRYYLEDGDLVEAAFVTLKYINSDYELQNLIDATIEVYDEKNDCFYDIRYAWDIKKSDPMYGKPFYTK